jgi:DNA polymerase-3 subunit alpha/error-prone DNA polymerase
VQKHFRRSLPKGENYEARLARELLLIEKFKFEPIFLQIREILDLVPTYKWITRGSAGCSLVAYLLGIHNMDPVKNNFVLSRFMHEARSDFPDVDIDFAYNQRDSVVEKIFEKYPGRVGRISNHVKFKFNSAIRHAIRENGNRRFIPRNFDVHEIAGSNAEKIINRAQDLVGTQKNYSLHCGGLVIFPDKVPQELILKDNQIKLNKDEVEEAGLIKVDILCNRGMAQLNDLTNKDLEDYPEFDPLTAEMFCKGQAWGVTFGESPAQRQLHVDIQPKSRKDIIFSLALIRPLPSADGRRLRVLEQWNNFRNHHGHAIYDDDGIRFIQSLISCSESEAELFRKGFGKKDPKKIEEFAERIKYHPRKNEIMQELNYFALYSFCHAHATSYGNLVWALGYEKVRQPKKFWWSAINHAQSMYRPWVHVQEAKKVGLKFASFGRGSWNLDGDWLIPEIKENCDDGWYQYKKRGYWTSNRFMPGMFHQSNKNYFKFKGLIAAGRHHTVHGRHITFLTIGTATGSYLDLILDNLVDYERYDIIEGEGFHNGKSIKVDKFNFVSLPAEPAQKLLFNNI